MSRCPESTSIAQGPCCTSDSSSDDGSDSVSVRGLGVALFNRNRACLDSLSCLHSGTHFHAFPDGSSPLVVKFPDCRKCEQYHRQLYMLLHECQRIQAISHSSDADLCLRREEASNVLALLFSFRSAYGDFLVPRSLRVCFKQMVEVSGSSHIVMWGSFDPDWDPAPFLGSHNICFVPYPAQVSVSITASPPSPFPSGGTVNTPPVDWLAYSG